MEAQHSTPRAAAGPTDPVLQALARIEGRLASLEARLGPALELMEQAPGMAGTAMDIADDVAARLGDVDARLRSALSLLDRVSAPETMQQLEASLALMAEVPGMVATTMDIVDDAFRKAAAQGVNLGALVPAIEALALMGLKALSSPDFHLILEQSHRAAESLQAATARPQPPLGMFGLVKALSDPAVQRSLGVVVAYARAFGGTLADRRALPATTTP